MPLITLAQADKHLRLELEHDDGSPLTFTDDRVAELQLKITAAEAIILNYLKVAADASVDGVPDASPPVAPLWSDRDRAVVQSAALLALSALWDDEKERTIADYMAPMGAITLLLMRLRDPAIA